VSDDADVAGNRVAAASGGLIPDRLLYSKGSIAVRQSAMITPRRPTRTAAALQRRSR
jgi:hypothetical protein